jgi:endonuclease/exonuclease/phosphatase family metal-dependent hydrolase
LSRFPLTETSNIDVTIPPKKRRSILHARYRVRFQGGYGIRTRTVHVYNLHLGLSGLERRFQLRKFLESHPFVGLHHQTPMIVAGDFNDVWGTLGRRLLVPAGFRGISRPLRTFPAYAPIRALDSIYVKGDVEILHVHRARMELAKRASDHLPLIVELEIKKNSSPQEPEDTERKRRRLPSSLRRASRRRLPDLIIRGRKIIRGRRKWQRI